MAEAVVAGPGVAVAAEERVSVAPQWKLVWWRFRKHRLAMIGAVTIILFYVSVLIAPFLAYSDPDASQAQFSLLPPQPIYWFDEGRFSPYVLGMTGTRDLQTFQRVYVADPNK